MGHEHELGAGQPQGCVRRQGELCTRTYGTRHSGGRTRGAHAQDTHDRDCPAFGYLMNNMRRPPALYGEANVCCQPLPLTACVRPCRGAWQRGWGGEGSDPPTGGRGTSTQHPSRTGHDRSTSCTCVVGCHKRRGQYTGLQPGESYHTGRHPIPPTLCRARSGTHAAMSRS